jgi:hypothetical protein
VAIGEAYIDEMGWNEDNVLINSAIARKSDENLAEAVLNHLTDFSLRPDIQDLTNRAAVDYYEIKPETDRGGRRDLAVYDPLMQVRYPGSRRGAQWQPAGLYTIQGPYGIPLVLTIRVHRSEPGLLLYRSNGTEDKILGALLVTEIAAQSAFEFTTRMAASAKGIDTSRGEGAWASAFLVGLMLGF